MMDAKNKRGTLLVRKVSEVEAKPIQWLWRNRFALGKLSIIGGNPGLGKSQITASLAGIITTGGSFPMEQAAVGRGSVLFLSAEDDVGDTMRPRLEAVGADIDKVYVLEAVNDGYTSSGDELHRVFNLKNDISRLSEYAKSIPDLRLVIIDPISAYLGELDQKDTGRVRSALSPLMAMAEKHNVAVIAVAHLNKGGNQDVISRISGSMAYVAAARSAFAVMRDDENDDLRLFLPIKNNIGKDRGGLSFAVESVMLKSGIETSCVVWGNKEVTKTANEVMNQTFDAGESKTALQEAKNFIKESFYNSETVSSAEMKRDSANLGISWRTMQRALKDMGAESRKGADKDGRWYWILHNRTEQTANSAKCAKYAKLSDGG